MTAHFFNAFVRRELKLSKRLILIASLLGVAACTSGYTHGLNTHDQTIPIYSQRF